MKVRLIKYDCFNKGIPVDTIMEVIPGMEADAADVFNIPAGMCYLCKIPNGTLRYVLATDVEIVDASNIDWEQRRYEIAKEMLHVTSEWRTIYDIRIGRNEAAVRAVAYADALIEELKKIN